jgi:hypothetical protein
MMITAVALIALSLWIVAVPAQNQNVGLLKVVNENYPRQVSPSDKFTVSVDVEYAVSTNATIRAVAVNGSLDANGPELWHSASQNVTGGGDKIWTFNLTSPSTEGAMLFTFIAYYSNNGTWMYFNDTTFGPGYAQIGIKVAPIANLGIYLGYSNVQVSIGNVTLDTDAKGMVTELLQVGRPYLITVPSSVQFDNSTRLAFNSWEDGGNATSRTCMLDGDTQLNATYRPQYLVQINSIVPTYSYSDWYDRGANLTLRAEDSVPMSWPLGALGLKYTFLSWSGGVNSQSKQVNATVNGPMTISANFSADYSGLMILIIPVVGVLGAAVLFVLRKRSRKDIPTVTEPSKDETAKVCPKCNEPVEAGWNNCIYCGAKLGSEAIQDR